MKKKNPVLYIAQGGLVAALYVVLTVVFAPISFGAVQVRIAEALTILTLFTPAAVPGLFAGCLLGNILGGAILADILFGSLATLIGAFLGYRLRKNRWLVPIPTILANTLIVPFVLFYGYGLNEMALPLTALFIFVGEVASCGVLGELLASVLLRYKALQVTE